MQVWVALYCDCIYESSYGIISIHQTSKGAYDAMRKHLINRYNEWREGQLRFGRWCKGENYLRHEAWKVKKYDV